MRTILTLGVLFGVACAVPVRAQEGFVEAPPTGSLGTTSTMTMQKGGNTDPFKWSASPTGSRYSVEKGGNTDPFRWSAAPIPRQPVQHATSPSFTHIAG